MEMAMICRECGAEVPAGSSYCPSCAKPASEAVISSEERKVSPKARKKPLSLSLKIALALVVIILVSQTVLFVYTVPWSSVTVNVQYSGDNPAYAAVYLDGHRVGNYHAYLYPNPVYQEIGTWSITPGTHVLEIDYRSEYEYEGDYYYWPDGVMDLSEEFKVGFFSDQLLRLELT